MWDLPMLMKRTWKCAIFVFIKLHQMETWKNISRPNMKKLKILNALNATTSSTLKPPWFAIFKLFIQKQNLTHANSVECPSRLSTSWISISVWFMREKSFILVNFVEENTIVQNLWKNINSKCMALTKRASINMAMSSIFNLKFLVKLSFQRKKGEYFWINIWHQ